MHPLVVPRGQHTLSRRDVDPEALKVLYRLKDAGFTAYIVGGGVRDLLLGRRPKDFDIGTDAHPYQVKKLFRNCVIIGRRFRLAHIRFGTKVIEVATFRRQVTAEETKEAEAAAQAGDASSPGDADHLIHRDNTFGTPEEDAFRRDFTLNGLFYDIATFSIIDYVGGLEDLKARLIRCIGDPVVRFREDPVRMQRAVSFAARLDFSIDRPITDAIAQTRHELARAAPARLAEEYYKILRSGSAERTFRELHRAGLLEPLSDVLHRKAGDEMWASLARLDEYRRRFEAVPATLTNAILLGSLIVPLGFSAAGWPAWMEHRDRPGLNLGILPLARRDVERIHQVLVLQRRMREPSRSGHARRMLMQRSAFIDALTWLEIHGDAPDMLPYWHSEVPPTDSQEPRPRRRRRRRRPRAGFPSHKPPE
ncbi:MAG: polynucleotide adenylyltransferase PcnB [Acidobacteria bacterium]|nr:polynucleotide adenylyltransferase PcnB [Acidobacteriota bacterium]